MQLGAVLVGKMAGGGIVFIAGCQSICQLAAGIDPTGQHICQCISHFHAAKAHIDHGADAGDLLHKPKIHRAGIQHHHGVGIMPGNRGQILPLPVGKQPIALFSLTVTAFAGITANYIDRSFGLGSFHILRSDLGFFCQNGNATPFPVDPAQGLILFIHQAFMVRAALQPVAAGQPEACVFQTLLHRDRMRGKYIAASGAAINRTGCTGAEQGDFPRLHRQRAIIFQQDNAFCSGSADQRCIFRMRKLT